MNGFGKVLGIFALLGLVGGVALLFMGSAAQASGDYADSYVGFGFVLLVIGILCGILWLVVGATKRPNTTSSQGQQLITREDGSVGYGDVPPPSNR